MVVLYVEYDSNAYTFNEDNEWFAMIFVFKHENLSKQFIVHSCLNGHIIVLLIHWLSFKQLIVHFCDDEHLIIESSISYELSLPSTEEYIWPFVIDVVYEGINML